MSSSSISRSLSSCATAGHFAIVAVVLALLARVVLWTFQCSSPHVVRRVVAGSFAASVVAGTARQVRLPLIEPSLVWPELVTSFATRVLRLMVAAELVPQSIR